MTVVEETALEVVEMFAGAIFCEETKLLPADEVGREVGVEERGC